MQFTSIGNFFNDFLTASEEDHLLDLTCMIE